MSFLKNIRREYNLSELSGLTINPDPIMQFSIWMDEAINAKVIEATAMSLSTVSSEGRPSSRIVLLKHSSNKGFDFFTNYTSKKGRHLKDNQFASLLFFWPEVERQIRIEGKVIQLPEKESDEYFEMRPRQSQISAWASPQSTKVVNRKTLVDWYEEFEEIFKSKPLSRPQHWGGYRLLPDLIEFWQGRENRLHDRFEFLKTDGNWKFNRLAP